MQGARISNRDESLGFGNKASEKVFLCFITFSSSPIYIYILKASLADTINHGDDGEREERHVICMEFVFCWYKGGRFFFARGVMEARFF